MVYLLVPLADPIAPPLAVSAIGVLAHGIPALLLILAWELFEDERSIGTWLWVLIAACRFMARSVMESLSILVTSTVSKNLPGSEFTHN